MAKSKLTELYNTSVLDYENIGNKAKNLAIMFKHGFNIPKGFIISMNSVVDDNEIYNFFNLLELKTVAVRSSHINEDSQNKSFAGQFKTKLNVDRNHLIAAIHEVKEVNLAIIIQEMINADISGVAFSINPVNQNQEIIIEYVLGCADNLVSGITTPNRIIIKKIT